MKRTITAWLILAMTSLPACTSYKSQYVSFRPPEAYLNYQVVDGVSLGAEAYPTNDEAEKAFCFDIKGAGLLPVQIVMDNKSGRNLELVPGQTFLVDNENRYWNVVPTNTAIDRLDKSTQLASFFGKGAGKGAVLGATGGAILGQPSASSPAPMSAPPSAKGWHSAGQGGGHRRRPGRDVR